MMYLASNKHSLNVTQAVNGITQSLGKCLITCLIIPLCSSPSMKILPCSAGVMLTLEQPCSWLSYSEDKSLLKFGTSALLVHGARNNARFSTSLPLGSSEIQVTVHPACALGLCCGTCSRCQWILKVLSSKGQVIDSGSNRSLVLQRFMGWYYYFGYIE